MMCCGAESSPQRSPLREIQGQTWEFDSPGKHGSASLHTCSSGQPPETPVWKGNARVSSQATSLPVLGVDALSADGDTRLS